MKEKRRRSGSNNYHVDINYYGNNDDVMITTIAFSNDSINSNNSFIDIVLFLIKHVQFRGTNADKNV